MDREYVYHYTTAAGLLGIIQNRTFWASKSSFMNDPSELHYARELIGKEVEQRVSPDGSEFLDTLFAVLDATLVYDDIYLLSFSLAPDALAMWNRYGKNDGYCLCFHGDRLNESFKEEFGRMYVGQYKVVYDEVEQKKLISNTLEALTIEHDKVNFRVGAVAKHVEDLILSLLFSIKHPCYREESEIRYIFAIPNQLGGSSGIFEARTNFRTRSGIICPYIEVGVTPDSVLEKVFLSPINDSSMSSEGIDMFLRKHVGGKGVLSSRIPYRST